MLPWLFHPDLTQIDEKHPTQCVAVTVHFLLRKVTFKTAISQTKVAEKFRLAPKKLHKAITGQKYDPGHKSTKVERKQKKADAVKPSPKKDKSPEEKQQAMTSGRKTDEATLETSEMDTAETEMPPLLEVSNDESDDDENGAKGKKFQFKKPTPKHHHGLQLQVTLCTPPGST